MTSRIHAGSPFPRRLLWPGIPVAVVVGVSVHLVVANLIGAAAGQYAGFAVTIGCFTWFMMDHDRGTLRFNTAASIVAVTGGVLVLYALHLLPI
jgi:hypothetical protein